MIKLSDQMKRKATDDNKIKRTKTLEGNTEIMISTGSTLLDLAISGGRVRGGGLPGGIFVEIFGPSGSGKTVLLCEIAGGVARQGGEIMFRDPEARLNEKFAKMFDLQVSQIDYAIPNTVPEVFNPVRHWTPKNLNVINGSFNDSLAALSTDMEMDKEEGDKMGMRRAKEFSEHLRKTCRVITEKNFLMVASNQIRENPDAGQFAQKWTSPGGKAIAFYASLRLRMVGTQKIKKEIKVSGKTVRRVIGVKTDIEVYKSSIWRPHMTAPLTILFDYGIDDIRQNLQYVKDFTSNKIYMVGKKELDKSMVKSIAIVEDLGLEKKLRNEVIDLWEDIETRFEEPRARKKR